MKHAFVVLAYQESRFLEESVKSVLRQKGLKEGETDRGGGVEVLLFTTTPNELVRGVAKKYGLELKIGKHTSIGGDFDAALKAGMETGAELVTIAHQDDVYEEGYAEAVEGAFLRNPEAQIIFTDYFEIKKGERVYKNGNLKIKRVLLTPLRLRVLTGRKWVKRFALRFGDAICCPAVTFVAAKVKMPVFECGMRCDVDWYAWEKLSRRRGRFVYIARRLMGHRVHEGSETSKTIGDDARSGEDLKMFRKFWPEWIAKRLTNLYKRSEESNKV